MEARTFWTIFVFFSASLNSKVIGSSCFQKRSIWVFTLLHTISSHNSLLMAGLRQFQAKYLSESDMARQQKTHPWKGHGTCTILDWLTVNIELHLDGVWGPFPISLFCVLFFWPLKMLWHCREFGYTHSLLTLSYMFLKCFRSCETKEIFIFQPHYLVDNHLSWQHFCSHTYGFQQMAPGTQEYDQSINKNGDACRTKYS